jgi:Transglycosylase SLT domain
MPATALRYGWRDLHDPGQAIEAAGRYLKNLQAMFAGRLDQILASYNAGEAAVEAYRTGRTLVLPSGKIINPKGIRSDIPPYRETVGYVTNGLAVFRRLAAAKYFSAPHLARLQIIETPREEAATLITVDLEEMPEDLKKGSVYAVEADDKPSPHPNLPKNSKTQSVYSH